MRHILLFGYQNIYFYKLVKNIYKIFIVELPNVGINKILCYKVSII